jgi:glyoxylase-like metal-dependent hydrolase (beta-lactamase superfamily II)
VTSWTVGGVRITKVPQMTWHIPLYGLVPEATADACARVAPGLLDDGVADISLHGLVVEAGDRRILVDTCAGHDETADRILGVVRNFGSITDHEGDVRGAVVAAGWAPEDIDTVLCTHLHFDHVGGNLADGEPAFPAARYVFSGDEWAFWATNESDDQYGSVDSSIRPLVDGGVADLVDLDHVVTDALRLVPTPGHTPGHVSVLIESSGEQAVITGDLAHHPVELMNPAWTMVADEDPVLASATRRQFVDRFGDGETLILGTHFGGSSAGHFDASTSTWTPA